MDDEELLEELRTIRTLIAIDKKEYLEKAINNNDKVHDRILEELEYSHWTKATQFKGVIAEEYDISKKNRTAAD